MFIEKSFDTSFNMGYGTETMPVLRGLSSSTNNCETTSYTWPVAGSPGPVAAAAQSPRSDPCSRAVYNESCSRYRFHFKSYSSGP